MDSNTTKRAASLGICAVVCMTIGALTAPLGIPLAGTLIYGLPCDLGPLLGILGSADLAASWHAYMTQALANARGVICLAAWCALIAACVGLYALVKQLQRPDRNVERGVLGDARLIIGPAEIRRRNDFWDGKGRPEGAGLDIGSSGRGYSMAGLAKGLGMGAGMSLANAVSKDMEK